MKIHTKNILLGSSIILYSFSICFQQTIYHLFGYKIILVLRLLAIVAIVLLLLRSKSRKIDLRYALLSLIMFMPFLWDNALFADKEWFKYISYILIFLYSALLSMIEEKKKICNVLSSMFILFGIITGLFSWLELFSFDTYIAFMKPFFSSSVIEENTRFFMKEKDLFGFTDHYSRNAFYIVMAIIFSFFKTEGKKKYFLILFLSATLLAVGKRGHLLFLIISAIISFFIIKKVKIKTIAKIAISSLVIIGSLYILSFGFPQIKHTIERAEESASSDDITTGRSKMYENARTLYIENNRVPIGWGKYASSTHYYHPALHNDYLQLYYEVGIIGEAMVVIPNITLLIFSAKGARKGKLIYKIALVYNIFFLTYSLTGLPRYDQETQFVYYTLNSMLFTRSNNEKKN